MTNAQIDKELPAPRVLNPAETSAISIMRDLPPRQRSDAFKWFSKRAKNRGISDDILNILKGIARERRINNSWPEIEEHIEIFRVAASDDPIFSQLCTALATLLKLHAQRAGLQSADAEDMAAESLAKIILNFDKFEDRGEGSFRAWCLRLAANHLKNWFRDRPKEQTVDESVWRDTPDLADFQFEGGQSELGRRIEVAFSELEEVEREIVMQRAIYDLQFPEIAQQLGLKTATVRQKFHRAKRKLRRVR